MRATTILSLLPVLSLSVACGDKEEEDDSGTADGDLTEDDGGEDGTGDDGSGDDGSGDDGGTDSCSTVDAGRWETTGACFGHPMDAELSFDAASCSFAFSDWSMDMDLPEGGTVSGDTVTLSGASWTSCSGTLSADGSSITGICDDSGCAFGLALQ